MNAIDKFGWILTDDDAAQYVRRAGLAPLDNEFELFQITAVPNGFYISHASVNTDELAQEDVDTLLSSYGYDSLEEFVMETSTGTDFHHKEDGSIDRDKSPDWIVEWQLIAEMAFETDALDNLGDECFSSWDEAREELEACLFAPAPYQPVADTETAAQIALDMTTENLKMETVRFALSTMYSPAMYKLSRSKKAFCAGFKHDFGVDYGEYAAACLSDACGFNDAN